MITLATAISGTPTIGVARRGPRGRWPPRIFRIHSDFVLWEAVSQTKYCYSPKIKYFDPPQIFLSSTNFWAGYATDANAWNMLLTGSVEVNALAQRAFKKISANILQ